MGTGTPDNQTETAIVPCHICGQVPSAACDWRQGRCPYHKSLLEQILDDNHKARFFNLLNWFNKKK